MHGMRGPGRQQQSSGNNNQQYPPYGFHYQTPGFAPQQSRFRSQDPSLNHQPFGSVQSLLGFANLRIQGPPRDEPPELPTDPNISDRKIEEFRRSLFVPIIPAAVSSEDLTAVFRSFGSLQECIVKDKENHRFAIVIYVEPESAYDVLRSEIVISEKLIKCEPRMIGGKTFAPFVPADVEMPARIQTVPGMGRGVPFSVVADQLPIVSGSSYTTEAFPPLGAPKPRHNGPVATRAPIIQQNPNGTPASTAVGPGHVMQGAPILLPMANQNQPRPNQPVARPPKKQPLRSFELVLHKMPFLGLSQQGLEQMYLLMHNVELKPAELAARDDLRHQLEITFRRIFKNCRVRMYGSSANTFGVRGSDIDAFLDLNLDSLESDLDVPEREKPIKYYYRNVTELQRNPYAPAELKKFTKQEILQLMDKLMRYLAKSHDWDYIQSIPEARTPILKLHQAHSNMSIDISFSSKMVFQNTGLLILYSHLDPRLRPLVYTIRRWAEMKQLAGDMAFTKYALTMLIVFFLYQIQPAVLPTPEQIVFWVESEQAQPGPSGDGQSTRSAFSFDMPLDRIIHLAKVIPPSLNKSTAAELLLQFFTFYASFPFTNHVMSCFSGEVIPIESFPMPEDGFKLRYVNLQDPFDLAHNIAKSVGLPTFTAFREFLRQEVCVFSRIPLDLVVLFNIDYTAPDLPPSPVMVSISASRKFPVKEDSSWGPKVADLTQKMLLEFFRCEFVREISAEDFGALPFSGSVHQLGPIVRNLHCRMECRSWSKRRNVRKQLAKNVQLSTLQEEWDVEVAIGERLHSTTHKSCAFDFYVTVMVNTVEAEKVCISLSCPKQTDTIAEFFDILWKFLPDQTRRYLKMDEPIIQAATSGEDPSAIKAELNRVIIMESPADLAGNV